MLDLFICQADLAPFCDLLHLVTYRMVISGSYQQLNIVGDGETTYNGIIFRFNG